MKKIFLCVTILSLALTGWGQKIKGLVLDEETNAPIDYASVFFDGTFVGTTTDEDGGFELDVSKYKSRPLSISAVGYHSSTITAFKPGESIEVRLTPRVFQIDEVVVSTKSLVRKRKACMRIFKNEFIGLTSNARQCYILNEEDITFNYGSDSDTLRAFASKPIHIRNLSLGYDISYHLDRFEYDRRTRTTLFVGNIIFNHDLSEDKDSLQRYKSRRAFAYAGSSMHFFRALWAGSLESEGFFISNYKSEQVLQSEYIVSQDIQGRKFLIYNEDIKIDYYNQISYISFREFQVYFEEDGYFNPLPIVWTGKMSEQRVADFLPYEYLSPR
jgi:hypothetical protein